MCPCNLPLGQALLLADGREIYVDHMTTGTSQDSNQPLWTARRGVWPLHYDEAEHSITKCTEVKIMHNRRSGGNREHLPQCKT